jgi:CheY-like chemotaxis protein
MDLRMLGIDGLEVTRRIRRQLEGHPLPIIALTANLRTQDQAACQQAGMEDFLGTPYEYEELRECVKRWLNAKASPYRG